MKQILYLNQKFSQIFFFILLIFGLSISILLKEFNLLLLPNYDLNIINIYRITIIIFSINVFLSSEKKINLPILLLILVNIIFIYNSLFGEEMTFNILASDFYNQINVGLDTYSGIPVGVTTVLDPFFNNSKKYLLINIFNIMLPLCVFLFIFKLNFKLNTFKTLSRKICSFFLYALCFIIFIKFSIIVEAYIKNTDLNLDNIKYVIVLNNISDLLSFLSDVQNFFFNPHGIIFILNFYFLLIIDKIYTEEVGYNSWDLIKIFLILFCIIIFNSPIHLLICLMTFLFYYLNHNKKFKYFFYSFTIFGLVIFLIFFKDIYINLNNINEHGSIINSILIRIYNIKYFFFHSENFNYIIGNNIFSGNIYTYPHNMFADILICTGVTGLTLFLFFLYKLFLTLKNLMNSNNLFLICLLLQSFLLANLSGFFFSNIAVFSILIISFIFLKEKESNII